MKMCSLNDSALKTLAEQPESQDLSQNQKIPWRSEDTLWGRSRILCEEFYVSRHQIEQRETCEKTQQALSLTSGVAPALDSSEKETTNKGVSVGCRFIVGHVSTGKLPRELRGMEQRDVEDGLFGGEAK